MNKSISTLQVDRQCTVCEHQRDVKREGRAEGGRGRRWEGRKKGGSEEGKNAERKKGERGGTNRERRGPNEIGRE